MHVIEERNEKKGNSLLEDLFYGGIRPSDSFQPDTPDIRRLNQEADRLYSAIKALLPRVYLKIQYCWIIR